MNTNTNTNTSTIEDDQSETGRSRVYWTEEEREMLKLSVIEYFTATGVPSENWVVTHRNLMRAQLEIISEERFRYCLRDSDIEDTQARINEHIKSVSAEGILNAHYAHVAKWHKTPIQHAVELLTENESLFSRMQIAEERVSCLEKELETLRSNASLQFVHASSPAKSKAEAPQSKIRVAVCGTHLNPEQRTKLGTLADIVWIENSHAAKEAARMVSGLSVLMVKGSCNTTVAKAMRATAVDMQQCNGYSSLLAALTEIVEAETAPA